MTYKDTCYPPTPFIQTTSSFITIVLIVCFELYNGSLKHLSDSTLMYVYVISLRCVDCDILGVFKGFVYDGLDTGSDLGSLVITCGSSGHIQIKS